MSPSPEPMAPVQKTTVIIIATEITQTGYSTNTSSDWLINLCVLWDVCHELGILMHQVFRIQRQQNHCVCHDFEFKQPKLFVWLLYRHLAATGNHISSVHCLFFSDSQHMLIHCLVRKSHFAVYSITVRKKKRISFSSLVHTKSFKANRQFFQNHLS